MIEPIIKQRLINVTLFSSSFSSLVASRSETSLWTDSGCRAHAGDSTGERVSSQPREGDGVTLPATATVGFAEVGG